MLSAHPKRYDVFEESSQVNFVSLLGTISLKYYFLWVINLKSPFENVERITPNIYNVDIGGYLF